MEIHYHDTKKSESASVTIVSWGRIGLQITTKTLRDGVLLRKFRRIQNFRLLQCHIWSTCLAEFNVLCLTVSLRTKYKSEHKFAVAPCKIICFHHQSGYSKNLSAVKSYLSSALRQSVSSLSFNLTKC